MRLIASCQVKMGLAISMLFLVIGAFSPQRVEYTERFGLLKVQGMCSSSLLIAGCLELVMVVCILTDAFCLQLVE